MSAIPPRSTSQQQLAQVCLANKRSEFRGYFSSLSTRQLFNRSVATTAIIATTTGTGIVAGGVLGGVAIPGVGVVPGAVAGGMVGGAIGVSACGVYMLWEYKDFKQIKNQERVITWLQSATGIENCPITQEFPIYPVVLTTSPKVVYDRVSLEKWVRERGTDPVLRNVNVTLNDIKVSTEALGRMANVCKEALAHPNPVFTQEENKGLALLASDVKKVFDYVLGKETAKICKELKEGTIGLTEAGERFAILGRIANPLPHIPSEPVPSGVSNEQTIADNPTENVNNEPAEVGDISDDLTNDYFDEKKFVLSFDYT